MVEVKESAHCLALTETTSAQANAKALPLLESTDGQGVAPCCPPLTERPMTAEAAETAARMFKALGDPVGLRLFSAVASHEGGEACVCDISDVGVSQPTVSMENVTVGSRPLSENWRPATAGASSGLASCWRWWNVSPPVHRPCFPPRSP
ncbi:transcriptional regulator [Streptomyces sp. NPDC101166]|uniref:transcriptional regulator n=1 Tax=Streptomyces sp. NPDC101166 TaxID=3366120 RepID=UPI003816DBF3